MPNPYIAPIPEVNLAALFGFDYLRDSPVPMPPQEQTSSPTVAQLLKLPAVTHPYEDALSSFKTDQYIKDDTYIGVEVEVEGIPYPPIFEGAWECKQDGSLRNYGVEYVTFPTPARLVPTLFSTLQAALKQENTPSYSSRTSIHVHMNIRDMSVEQIKSFILLYLCFEKLLYEFAGNSREKSIFCVPLSHAGYVPSIKRLFSLLTNERYAFKGACNEWHKYTGLNLHPGTSFGTIEFRHLSGTDDTEVLRQWIALILKMRKVAMVTSKESLYTTIIDLNTNSEYEQFASFVFEEARRFLHHSLQEYMEGDVTHIKECFSADVHEEISKEKFILSSFFSAHKIKKIVSSEEEEQYANLSVKELTKLLLVFKEIYNTATTSVEKDEAANKYRLILKYKEKAEKLNGAVEGGF